MPGNDVDEAQITELRVGFATLSAEIKSLNNQVDRITADAREARDAGRQLLASQEGQNIPAQLAELKGMIAQIGSSSRADLVNTSDKITREFREKDQDLQKCIDAVSIRVDTLESDKERRTGAFGVVGWVSKHAPWLLPMAVAAGAAIGVYNHDHP